MVSQLTIYNEALGHLGERQLAQLANGNIESRESKRVLDSYWSDTVAYALAQGLWKFAKRTIQVDASTEIVPQFTAWNWAFPAAADFVRVILVSTAPEMNPPLLQYSYEAGVFYANQTPLYISYVSNDPTYGMNIAGWPEHFTDYVEKRLAVKACYRITGSRELLTGKDGLINQENTARRVAKAEEAMDEPPGLPPVAVWARARRGNYGGGGLFGPGSTVTGPSGND